jgi:hypothetical protein
MTAPTTWRNDLAAEIAASQIFALGCQEPDAQQSEMAARQRSALGNFDEGAVRIENEGVPHDIAKKRRGATFNTATSQHTGMCGDAIPDLNSEIAKATRPQFSNVCHRAPLSRDQ